MRVTPKSDAEIEAEQEKFKPLKGIFDFEVLEASDEISKKGNDMIKLKLCVYRPSGGEQHTFDYLLDAMAFKVKHFCEATGLLDRYEAGDLNASDCAGKSGRLELRLEKDDKGNDKSVVKDYNKKMIEHSSVAPKIATDLNDEIPF